MPRGRPRKPDALKRLEGNRGKGLLNENPPVPQGGLIRPPYITGYAAEIWEQITSSMPVEMYSKSDSSLLATFCVAVDQFRSSTEAIQRDGVTIEDQHGDQRAHPAGLMQGRAVQTIASLGARLGLDPVSRASMRMPQPKKETSKFEGLMNAPINVPEGPISTNIVDAANVPGQMQATA